MKFVNNEFYEKKESTETILHYVSDPVKTNGWLGSMNVSSDVDMCRDQFQRVRSYFDKDDGRKLVHFVVSARVYDYLTDMEMWENAKLIARYFAPGYQIFWAIHKADSASIYNAGSCRHIHFVMNSVSFADGKKFHQTQGELQAFKKYVDKIVSRVEQVIWGRN